MFLLLIDANHIIENTWRSSAATGRIDAGTFFNKCLASVDRALNEHNPSHVLLAFSDSAQSSRKERNPEYRFGQWVLPESYRVKMFGFRKALRARGVAFTSLPGVESRDIIATIASKIKTDTAVSVGILGTSKAYLPLVSDQVVMINHFAKFPDERLVTKTQLEDKLGFSGQKILDMLVLEGDSELNIKGIKGIGRKTASSLIQRFDSLSGLNSQMDEIPDDTRSKVKDFFDNEARTSYLMWRNAEKLKLGFRFNDLKYAPQKRPELVEASSPRPAEKIG